MWGDGVKENGGDGQTRWQRDGWKHKDAAEDVRGVGGWMLRVGDGDAEESQGEAQPCMLM